MKLSGLAAAIVALLLVPLTSWAMPPVESTVEYSADSVMETEGGMTVKSRLYQAPGKQRMEMGGAEGGVTIIRKDKQVMWQLIGDMYMEMPFDQSKSSGLEGFDIQEQTEVGQEVINGMKTTKTKVIAVKKDGSKFGGFFWTTKEGVVVKTDMLSKEGDRKVRIALELSNVKIEKQDPALFEIPPGLTKNDMGAMMGQSGMPNLEEMMKGAREEQPRERRPSRERSERKTSEEEAPVDMNKMLKGLFGR
ncbi:MAG: hypothetical protein KF814_03750 [Nitrospiraceae bacterium]|nr:hypothetical protein [Nitrospiraceae bacterium]